jgi:hypothetical protein
MELVLFAKDRPVFRGISPRTGKASPITQKASSVSGGSLSLGLILL